MLRALRARLMTRSADERTEDVDDDGRAMEVERTAPVAAASAAPTGWRLYERLCAGGGLDDIPDADGGASDGTVASNNGKAEDDLASRVVASSRTLAKLRRAASAAPVAPVAPVATVVAATETAAPAMQLRPLANGEPLGRHYLAHVQVRHGYVMHYELRCVPWVSVRNVVYFFAELLRLRPSALSLTLYSRRHVKQVHDLDLNRNLERLFRSQLHGKMHERGVLVVRGVHALAAADAVTLPAEADESAAASPKQRPSHAAVHLDNPFQNATHTLLDRRHVPSPHRALPSPVRPPGSGAPPLTRCLSWDLLTPSSERVRDAWLLYRTTAIPPIESGQAEGETD